MSVEEQRLKKIVDSLKKNTSLKDERKVMELAKAVDEFSSFVLQIYLESKKNEGNNIL